MESQGGEEGQNRRGKGRGRLEGEEREKWWPALLFHYCYFNVPPLHCRLTTLRCTELLVLDSSDVWRSVACTEGMCGGQ